LVGGFIIRTVDKNQVRYNFFNPSIEDFLFDYFENSIEEYFQVLESAVYFEQFKYRITINKKKNEKRIDFSNKSIKRKLYKLFKRKEDNLK
ncbi:hypothetical protein, partial [Brevibacillus sp. SIMBA_040]